jgi:hypothetical protein
VVMTFTLAEGAEPEPEAPPGARQVQIDKASVKPRPAGFVPTVEILSIGTPVETLGPPESGYVKIRYGQGKTGYILASSLATPDRYKEVQASAATAKQVGEGTSAYGAVKGWDKDTEKEYSSAKNLGAAFLIVNRIEKEPYANASTGEIERLILQFAAEGKLGEAAHVP